MAASGKPQSAWALINRHGDVVIDRFAYSRKYVIANLIGEYRLYPSNAQYADLSDAQFWRILKRSRSWKVRRVLLKVARR